VIEQPHQILCTVLIREKEAYIPVHESNILQIDHQKRQIHVEIPEGLLDIYTG
jgi:16S rRNA processing protein RimM